MKQYIDKSKIVVEIERRKSQLQSRITELGTFESNTLGLLQEVDLYDDIISFLDTLKVKEVDLIDRKTDWSPSKKQLESLKDLLHYNIGVFDYQKFMEVNSLYEDLIKLLDYETDRQK